MHVVRGRTLELSRAKATADKRVLGCGRISKDTTDALNAGFGIHTSFTSCFNILEWLRYLAGHVRSSCLVKSYKVVGYPDLATTF